MTQQPSRSAIAPVLLLAALLVACLMPVAKVLPTVEHVPAPRGPMPSALLVLQDPVLSFPNLGGEDLGDHLLTGHVETATRDAALFKSFRTTTLADARLPDVDYTIRLRFAPEPPRYSTPMKVLSLFTLFVVPSVSHFPIVLSATIEDPEGTALKQYTIEDEITTVLALWDLLLLPFTFGSRPGDVIENMMMTLYLQMAGDGALETR